MLVEFDTALGALDGTNLAAQAVHLGISGDAGLHPMSSSIAADRVMIETSPTIISVPWGRGPDEGHASLDHVEQLRQFVDAEATQEPAPTGVTRGSSLWWSSRANIGHVGVHGAELEDVDRLVVEADPRLNEQIGPGLLSVRAALRSQDRR